MNVFDFFDETNWFFFFFAPWNTSLHAFAFCVLKYILHTFSDYQYNHDTRVSDLIKHQTVSCTVSRVVFHLRENSA